MNSQNLIIELKEPKPVKTDKGTSHPQIESTERTIDRIRDLYRDAGLNPSEFIPNKHGLKADKTFAREFAGLCDLLELHFAELFIDRSRGVELPRESKALFTALGAFDAEEEIIDRPTFQELFANDYGQYDIDQVRRVRKHVETTIFQMVSSF